MRRVDDRTDVYGNSCGRFRPKTGQKEKLCARALRLVGRHSFSLQTAVDSATVLCWSRDGSTASRPKPKAVTNFLDESLWAGRELKLRVAGTALAQEIIASVADDAELVRSGAQRHPYWASRVSPNPLDFLDLLAKTATPGCPQYTKFGLTQAACRVYGALALRAQDTPEIGATIGEFLDDPGAFYKALAQSARVTVTDGVVRDFPLNPATLVSRYKGERILRYPNAPPLMAVTLWEHPSGITEDAVRIVSRHDEWGLPAHLEPRLQPLLDRLRASGKRIYNNKNARLEGYSWDNDSQRLTLELRPTWYFYHVATNASVDTRVGSEKSPLRDSIIVNKKFEPLASSQLSNELGLNAIVVSADDRIVLPQRSGSVVGTADAIGPSVSGAVAWYHTDAHGVCPFQAIRSQLSDELGVHEADLSDLRLLSLSRGLLWAGHPSVRFVVRTKLTFDEILGRFRVGTRDGWEARGPKALTAMPANDILLLESVIRNPGAAAPLRASLVHYLAHLRASA